MPPKRTRYLLVILLLAPLGVRPATAWDFEANDAALREGMINRIETQIAGPIADRTTALLERAANLTRARIAAERSAPTTRVTCSPGPGALLECAVHASREPENPAAPSL
jgi:hypothetical protein